VAERVLGGRYRIERHLARGGMAEVYLAHDQLLDRPVAVKVLFPELARDDSFVERFRRESQSAARLNHPNIVSVYDFGEDGEALFIVMEYVPGQTLSEIIRTHGPLAPGQAVAIAAEVAAGLEAAHREGIVHRDVKPANVLVTPDGVAKIADFGIAHAGDAVSDLTMPGTVIGTVTYLSPEQAQGLTVDPRSDVYSLGMVLYEMLTGTAPFRGDNPVAMAYKQQHDVLPAPSSVNPAVSRALDATVARALSVDPAQRQASAATLRAELLAGGRGPSEAEATAAFGLAATSVTPAAAPPSSPAPAGASAATTAMVASEAPSSGKAVGLGVAPAVYRRRRRVVGLGFLIVLALGAVIAVALLGGGGGTKGPRNPGGTLVTITPTTTTVPPTTAGTRPVSRTTTSSLPASTVPPTTLPTTTVPSTTAPPTTMPSTTVAVTTPPATAG
jgi:eukaryotic-like serine/threonine-protein kinase